MNIEAIGFIAIALGLFGFYFGPEFMVYIFFASTLLGAAGALTLEFLGGTNIQPAHLLLGFLAIKLCGERRVMQEAMGGLRVGCPGFWLFLTTLYGSFTAFLLPRLFAGQTVVVPVRAEGYNTLLSPSMSNVTQPVYFVGNFICFVMLYGLAKSGRKWRHLVWAALAVAVLNLVFAALDLTTYWTGTSEMLSFIRNASYAMLSDTESQGFKRIVGSFTEASSFGYASLGYFAFVTTLWLFGVFQRLTLSLSALTFLALIFSTSTTAYVGLAALLSVLYGLTLLRLLFRPLTAQMMIFMIGSPFLVAVLVLGIALDDQASLYFKDLIDNLVLNKMSTSSGVERSSWNAQAIQNFLDTFGFGVGNGSARTSSFPLAVVASLGFPGALLYGAFLGSVLFAPRISPDEYSIEAAVQSAAKAACTAWLIAASVSGALIDLGLPFFAFSALACARPQSAYRLRDIGSRSSSDLALMNPEKQTETAFS
jgi:hypothetical protein